MITDVMLRNIRPKAKPFKLYDHSGMYLIVAPSGGLWFRFKYLRQGKHKTLSLGTYPMVSLKQARERRDELKRQITRGIDPGAQRKAIRHAQADTLEAIAREWASQREAIWSPGHKWRILRSLEKDIFPWIGARQVGEITAPDLLAVMRRITSRGANETAHRALSICGQVFRYAVATGRAERDPSGDLRGALPPSKTTHLAAITVPRDVGALLRAVDGYQGSYVVRCALRLAPLVFVRPGELRSAEWKDIDFDAAEWRYVVSKTGTPHIVPLSRQSVEILRELHGLTGQGRYVFPSGRTAERPMSENGINGALRRLGYSKDEMTGHGFRAMARTILDEVLGMRPELIEHQLAHMVKDPLGRAYNRTKHLPERRDMMQKWATYLDQLRDGIALDIRVDVV